MRREEQVAEVHAEPPNTPSWQENWERCKAHHRQWWRHEGFVVGYWGGVGGRKPRETIETIETDGPEEWYRSPEARARHTHNTLASSDFPLDILPLADANLGPGSLALHLGCEAKITKNTVWFEPCMRDDSDKGKFDPIVFDPENQWWKIIEATLQYNVKFGRGKYLASCPDLVENIDILASMRDSQTLLMDMIENPGWVHRKLDEILQAWIEVYDRVYEIIKLPDQSSAFNAFAIWGDGKTAKVQCDASAMFSPEMFEEFVAPTLAAQCRFLDHSMFHLDGHQCVCHLDHLLAIEELDAIEWTPDPQVPHGADPHWFGMYRKILDAGKSLQIVGLNAGQALPLLDALGTRGLYLMVNFAGVEEARELAERIKPYRKEWPSPLG